MLKEEHLDDVELFVEQELGLGHIFLWLAVDKECLFGDSVFADIFHLQVDVDRRNCIHDCICEFIVVNEFGLLADPGLVIFVQGVTE